MTAGHRAPTLPTGAAKAPAVRDMFDRVAPSYDRVNRVISLGLDRGWRRRAVDALGVPPGSRVLDVACGTGDLCEELAARGHRAVGVDFSPGMLAAARTSAPLVRGDALALPVGDGLVDGVVCGFALRNLAELPAFFAECARVLRRGGRVVALDAAVPDHPLLRAGHAAWFRGAVPVVGALLGDDAAAYRYLPRSTAYLPPVDRMLRTVLDAGLVGAERRLLSGGAVQLVIGTRP